MILLLVLLLSDGARSPTCARRILGCWPHVLFFWPHLLYTAEKMDFPLSCKRLALWKHVLHKAERFVLLNIGSSIPNQLWKLFSLYGKTQELCYRCELCKACSGILKNLQTNCGISLALWSRMKILPKEIFSRFMWWRPRRDCERAGASLFSLWAERSWELEREAGPQDCKILFKIRQDKDKSRIAPLSLSLL